MEEPHEEPKQKVAVVQETTTFTSRRKHDDDSDFSIETSRLEDIDIPAQVAEKKKEPAKPQLKDAV